MGMSDRRVLRSLIALPNELETTELDVVTEAAQRAKEIRDGVQLFLQLENDSLVDKFQGLDGAVKEHMIEKAVSIVEELKAKRKDFADELLTVADGESSFGKYATVRIKDIDRKLAQVENKLLRYIGEKQARLETLEASEREARDRVEDRKKVSDLLTQKYNSTVAAVTTEIKGARKTIRRLQQKPLSEYMGWTSGYSALRRIVQALEKGQKLPEKDLKEGLNDLRDMSKTFQGEQRKHERQQLASVQLAIQAYTEAHEKLSLLQQQKGIEQRGVDEDLGVIRKGDLYRPVNETLIEDAKKVLAAIQS